MRAPEAGHGAAWPVASTRLVALLGWPARHSLSPVMHNAAFRELDLDLVYLALPTPPPELDTVLEALGAIEAVGANVTLPHKEAVLDRCDVLTEEAELVGAVNTLAWGTDGLLGDNTDAVGLQATLTEDVGLSAESAAVILGTGGACRAAVVALGRLAAAVTVVGRRPDAAEEVARLAEGAGAVAARGVDLADEAAVREAVDEARLVVNATPLGMEGESLPDPFHELGPHQIAYDLVYSPPRTPFLEAARDRGAATHHGLGMLVAQAAASFRRWTGQPAPVTTMSAAATAALAGERSRAGPDD